MAEFPLYRVSRDIFFRSSFVVPFLEFFGIPRTETQLLCQGVGLRYTCRILCRTRTAFGMI